MPANYGDAWRPDGPVRYRYDAATGQRVGIMPATCKLRTHSLAEVGYAASEQNGQLRVSCKACRAANKPDHTWYLKTTPPTPATAELDDRPYAGIDPHYVVRYASQETSAE